MCDALQREYPVSVDAAGLRKGGSRMDGPWDQDLWSGPSDEPFTLTLVVDVAEVLAHHGYPIPIGSTLAELAVGLYGALHGCPLLPP